jgi:hypothetical protein
VRDRDAVLKLFEEIGPRFLARHGGYTRIMKIAQRPGDAAPMALLELIPAEGAEPESKPAPKGKGEKADKDGGKEAGAGKGKGKETGEAKAKPKARPKAAAAGPKVKKDAGARAPAKSAATMKRSSRSRGGD